MMSNIVEAIDQDWSETDVLQLTLKMTDSELDGELQQQACKGICQDMMLMGQCDSAEEHQSPIQKHWPLVVVDREKKKPEIQKTPKRTSWRGRYKHSRDRGLAPPVSPDTVDLVFVDQDKHSCVQAIEVCPSPSSKIRDLHTLQNATP